ncbi:aminotransferase class V-fold PLP-dependent enzyme [Crossiella sp. CA-258035]|uniref:aminotransferase class V-fold PLP-dependent enzyme n=1 Tax=Crossiella sp. CA-258035 TaxID=2981138 RepID=UPI0024BBFC3D|nr:aminotransferase class V-fold PLP-dependent enzyme [Crossiella sp. CA-258035]WHT17868.1 aminotransferase class V-fold PLP-dependent enzyme [Crossiella sp. CA-258035]
MTGAPLGDIEGVEAGAGLRLLGELVDEAVWLDHCPFVYASCHPSPAWLRHEQVSAFQPLPTPPPGHLPPAAADQRRVCVSFAPEHGDNARTWAGTHGYRLLAPAPELTAWAADKIASVGLFARAGVASPSSAVVPARDRMAASAYWKAEWPRTVAQRRENNLIGHGTRVLDSVADLRDCLAEWPDQPVKLSRFHPGISLTVTACAGGDRTVVSAVSHQLVGLPELAAAWGSHCGNQLLAPDELPGDLYRQARLAAWRVGELLRARGFRGMFGLDLVADAGRLLAIEVNPRFQTVVSLVQAVESDCGLLPALGLHMLAFLAPELPPTSGRTYPAGPRYSQLVVHAAADLTLSEVPPSGHYRADGHEPLPGPARLTDVTAAEAVWWAIAGPGPIRAGEEIGLLQFSRPVAAREPRPHPSAEALRWVRSFQLRCRAATSSLPPLRMCEADMRRAGRHAIELIIKRISTTGDRPTWQVPAPEALRAVLDEPLPEHGVDDLPALLDQVTEQALAEATRLDHPRSFAFVPATGNFPAVLAAALAAAYLSVPGAWFVGAGPTQLELTTLNWLKALLGLPEGHGGLFVSGGSVATLTALAVARDQHLDGHREQARLYCSSQTHPSVARAAHLIGLTREQLRVLPADEQLRLDPAALAEQITHDRDRGYRPFAVTATLGTTGTGAIDPLAELADLCEREDLWLHVDGAFGAAVTATSRGQHLRAALGRADSLTVDPHKWLFQPYEIGCVLLRRPELLPATFSLARHALDNAYLDPAHAPGTETNLSDHGPQQSRGLRALKLWLSLKTFGAAAFRDTIERGIDLAEHAGTLIQAHPELHLVTPPSLCVLTFAYRPRRVPADWDGDRAQERISRAVCAGGDGLVLTTRVRGAVVLRLCTINPASTRADVEAVLDLVVSHGRELQTPEAVRQ